MLPKDVQIVSVDDHVVEHPNVWQDRLPAKYKEAGPKNIRDDQGRDVWHFEGQLHFNGGLNAVAGKPREEFGMDPVSYDDMLPGCFEPQARVKDMDADGIHAQLCFPTLPGFAGSTFLAADDKDLAAACVSAWNDWMVDEWCAYAPGRQIPLALVPFWDIDKTVAEVERVAAKGSKAISFTEAPHNLGLPSLHTDHWDPLFAAAQDANLPLCMHFGSGGSPPIAPGGPFTAAIALFGLNSIMATVELVNSRIFERFPNLKVALSEGGIGWMPYILERTDYTWERHRFYTGMADAKRPSEIFRDHIYGCFISDEAGLKNIDLIGVDNIMFEGDYPHSDSNWPNARKLLEVSLADVPDDQARKIAESNARSLFNFPRA
ncbi:MAG TPA: amidohydrolase family protein [Acidimicrobiales bacterium]|nr:amidohydrolase family protein [Acidimicrobiales bacterium]